MPIDPTLLTKAAKVYEAAESVEGGKPKEVYESHKQCTPGEFGMNKEGGKFAKFVRKTANDLIGGPVPTPPGWDPKAPPPAMPPTDIYDVPPQTELSADYWNARSKWIRDHNPRINQILQQRGVKLNDSAEHNKMYREQERRMYEQEKAQAEYWRNKSRIGTKPPVAPPTPTAPLSAGGETIQQRLNRLNAARRAAGGEIPEGAGVVKKVDDAFSRGATSTSPFPAGKPVPPTVKKSAFVFGQLVAQIRN